MKSLPDESQIAEQPVQDMSWFTDLTGKAETLLNNIDERAASALKNRNPETTVMYAETPTWPQRLSRQPLHKKPVPETRTVSAPRRGMSPPVKQSPKTEKKELPKQLRKTTRRGVEVQNYRMLSEDRRKTGNETLISQDYGYRRKSIPNSKELEDMFHRCQKADTLALENQLLKDEVAGCNQDIAGLIDKLRAVEDDLKEMDTKYENLEEVLNKTKTEKDTIVAEMTKLKEKSPSDLESRGPEYSDLLSSYRALEQDFANVNDRNREYQVQIKELEMSQQSTPSIQMKLENDLRFAHMAMNDLRADLEKSRGECERIQSDWDAYKVRVKSMLLSKDKEIQALHEDPEFSEGTKMLSQQVESLREEREQLSCALSSARDECEVSARRAEQAEARAHSAERLVAALREALREERHSRNKAENQCIMNNKALKKLQMETTHQIAALHTTIRERDNQLHNYRNAHQCSETSVCPVVNDSALNVADGNRAYERMSIEKIQHLTQALVSKQGRIDALFAENNTLKLQMENIEIKYRQQLSGLQENKGIVTMNEGDAFLKAKLDNTKYSARSAVSRVSLRIGGMMRRHPVFRIFVIFYIVALQIWVMMILLTYTQGCAGEGEFEGS